MLHFVAKCEKGVRHLCEKEGWMRFKMPWLDRSKCTRELPCRAAELCKQAAFVAGPESGEEPGKMEDFPLIDLERCKQCGDCEHVCSAGAVKMI